MANKKESAEQAQGWFQYDETGNYGLDFIDKDTNQICTAIVSQDAVGKLDVADVKHCSTLDKFIMSNAGLRLVKKDRNGNELGGHNFLYGFATKRTYGSNTKLNEYAYKSRGAKLVMLSGIEEDAG